MNKYEYIVWDWNGTLLDDARLCYELANLQFLKRQHPGMEFDHYRLHTAHPFSEFFRRMGLPLSSEEYAQLSHDFHRDYAERRIECALHDQARTILQRIKSLGLHQSIISAHPQDMLWFMLEHHGLTPFFDVVKGKQHPLGDGKLELAEDWIREIIPVEGARILVVGDTDHDFEMAQLLGADCLLVSHGLQHPERLEKVGAPVVDSLRAVAELLLGQLVEEQSDSKRPRI